MSQHDAASQSRSDILLGLALLVNERRGVGEIFEDFAGRMLGAVAFDYACLFTAAEDPRVVRAVASYPPGVEPRFAGEVFPERSVGLRLLGSAPGGAEYGRGDIPDLVSGRNLMGSGFERAWVIGLPAGPAPLGLLAVARRDPGPFGGPEVAFLREAAGLLAGAVQRDRELCEAQASAARARAANAVSLELSSGSPPEDVFARLPELLAGALAFDYASLMRREGGHLRFLAEYPGAIHDPGTHFFDQIIPLVLEHGGIAESRTDRIGEPGEQLLAGGVVRVLDAVLVADREPLGLLTFGRREHLPFPAAEREFVGLLSNIFAQSMAGQQRLDRATVAAARSRVLNEVALLLNQGESIDAIFQRLLDLIGVAIEVDYFGLLEAGGAPGTMRMVGSRPEILRPAGAVIPHNELRLDILGKLPGPVIQYPVDRNPDESVFKQAMVGIGMRRGVSILIHHDGALAGFLSLARRNPDRYADEEVAFLETLSAMLGQAIVSRHRLDRSESAAARARVLNDAALLINTGAPAESIFDQILPLLHEAIDFDYADFFEAAHEPGVYRRVAHEPSLEGHERVWRPASYLGIEEVQAMGRGVLGYRLDRIAGQSVGAANLLRSGYTWAAVALGEVDGQVEGVFSLARIRDLRFSGDEQRFLVTLARMLGQAIANRRRLEEADRAAARSRLLSEIGVLLNDGSPPEAFFQRLAERLQAIVPFTGMALLVAESGGFRVAATGSGLLLKVGSLVQREDLGERMLAILDERAVGEGALEELGGRLAQLGLTAGRRRAAVCALRHDGAEIGHLLLTRTEDEAFRPEECADLELLGSLLAQAIANWRRLEESRLAAEQSRLLNEISVLVNNGDSPETFFNHLMGRLQSVVPFGTMVILVHDGPEMLRSVGSMTGQLLPAGMRLPLAMLGDGILQLLKDHSVAEGSTAEIGGPLAEQVLALGRQRFAGVALPHEGGALGYLALTRVENVPFSPEECEYLKVVATLLAQAIANRMRLEESQRKAEQSRLLSEISVLVNKGDSPEAFFDHLVARLQVVVPFDALVMFVHEGPEMIRSAGSMTGRLFPVGTRVPLASIGEDLMALIAERSVVEGSNRDMAGELAAQALELGRQRFAVVVLRQEGSALGYLVLVRTEDEAFSGEECAYLELVGTLLAQAAANRMRLEESQRGGERARLLNEISMLVNNGDSPGTFFDHLVGRLRTVVPFDAMVMFVHEGPKVIRSAGSMTGRVFPVGTRVELASIGEEMVGLLAERRVVEGSTREMGGELTSPVVPLGHERVAVVVLQHEARALGYLALVKKDPAPFTGEECAYLELVGTLLAQATANHQKMEESQEEATRQKLLSELAVMLQDERPIEDHFERLCGALLPAAGFDFIFLSLPDVTGDGYRPLSSEVLPFGGEPVQFEPEVIPFVRGAFGGLTQYRPSHASDRAIPAALARAGFQRAATAIIPDPGGREGIFTIARRDVRPFSEHELEFVKLVAALLGHAQGNRTKAVGREQQALRNRIVSELALLLNDGQPVEAHFERLRERLGEAVGFDYISVAARESTSEHYRTLRSVPLLDAAGNEAPFDAASLTFLTDNGLRSSQFGPEGVENGAPGNIFTLGLEMVFCVLLSAGTGIEGAFTVGRRAKRRFSREERAFLEAVGGLLSYAIANERRIAMSAQEAEEQAIVARAAAAVATEDGSLAIAAALRDAIGTFVAEPFVNFGFLEGERVNFPGRDGAVSSMPIGPNMRIALDEGVVVVPSPRESGGLEEVIRAAEELGLQHQVMTAARSGGEIIGMLIVGSRDPGYRFGEREVRLVRLITDIIGPGMAHVRAVERERREAEDQRVLAELAAVCAREADPVGILNQIAVELRPLIPRPVTVFGYRHGDEMVYPRADGAWIRLPLDPTFEVVDERGQSFTDELPEESDPTGILRQLGVRANCTTPIRSAGEIVGYLLVGSRDAGFTFRRRERDLMRQAAQIVGPAMENARAAMAAREEAEDQRILAEIAAIAAREPDADAIMNALPAVLAPLIPSPLVLNGLIRDHTAIYRVSDPALREMFGVDYASVPFSPAGYEALEQGQATGHTDDLPAEFRAAVSGVHAFALTHYQTAGLRVGTIMVATTDPEYTFSARVLSLLRRASQVLGAALDAARAQEEFNRQRELQGLILRSLTEGVVLLDSVGRAIFANTLGRKVLDALGGPGMVDTWEESLAIVPEAVRGDFFRAVRLGQAGRGRTGLEIDGRRVHLDYEFVPLDHPAFRALLVLADVTAQVQQEEEEERSRERMAQTSRLAALGELIGGVAHELNNPLTAILGFAEIIGLSEAAEPFTEEIAVIQKEALRARNIVRDLLFIARPGTSERGVVPVDDIVAHIERLRRSHWTQAGIAAEVRIDPECVAWGNEHQLTQVLLNLVTNAEQALAGRDGARLVIAARRDGERVLLTVVDNGKGMDEATRARIFEPFFTTRQGSGTGLGLPLSYSIVQSHQGTITVETAPGAGTTFIVDLPVHDEPAEPLEPEATGIRPSMLRMLVIDDEPSLRKVCQRLVESLGHSCESAENAAAALKLARNGDFDVVLCDYRLATETADQVLEGLELEAPHLIPRTILATGATTDAGVVRLVERYGLQLVAKPYGVEELSRILNESAARAG